MFIQNASHFLVSDLQDGGVCYTARPQKALPFFAFDEACKPQAYTHQFFPFAYVVFNQTCDEVLLIRDHIGVQPLYYCYQAVSNKFVFAETLPELLNAAAHPKPKRSPEHMRLEFIEPRTYSDNTIYDGVYRVEPGHMVVLSANGTPKKQAFWQLEEEGETLHYQDSRMYLEHFTALMDASIKDATEGFSRIGAEFSAGVDSTSVYLGCRQQNLAPTLFMNEATPGSPRDKNYNRAAENAFFEQYQPKVHRLFSEGFDPLQVFAQYAKWFAGPAPYIFEAFTHLLHTEVARTKQQVLLSGFGGDQGVSGHVPVRYILPELIHKKAYKAAFKAMPKGSSRLRQMLYFIQYAHPAAHILVRGLLDTKAALTNLYKPDDQKIIKSVYPQIRGYFKTLRSLEWHNLQGPLSHEIRMRVESSSIVAKQMGFEYRYPLLHPKLLEFYLSLPISQKRHEGSGRYLIRRYMAQYLPASIYNNYKKRTGLDIFPATAHLYKTAFHAGEYQSAFENLPYLELRKDKLEHMRMMKAARAFMLKISEEKIV